MTWPYNGLSGCSAAATWAQPWSRGSWAKAMTEAGRVLLAEKLPAQAAICAGQSTPDSALKLAREVFGAVGQVVVAEPLMDVVTRLSASGPAYVFLIIEALADGGVLIGLDRARALTLAAGTVAGVAELMIQGGQHPAQLKDMVTSPGGTTIAGLRVLENAAVRGVLHGGRGRRHQSAARSWANRPRGWTPSTGRLTPRPGPAPSRRRSTAGPRVRPGASRRSGRSYSRCLADREGHAAAPAPRPSEVRAAILPIE